MCIKTSFKISQTKNRIQRGDFPQINNASYLPKNNSKMIEPFLAATYRIRTQSSMFYIIYENSRVCLCLLAKNKNLIQITKEIPCRYL